MIEFIQNEKIDRAKWDSCIKSSDGFIYSTSAYLDIVAPGWAALIQNDYEAVMPIIWKSKFRIKYIYPGDFIQQAGVMSSTQNYNADDFVKNIPKTFRYIETNLNSRNEYSGEKQEMKNLILHLNKDYESLRKNFNENTRRNIRKSEDEGLIVERSYSIETVINLFQTNKGKEVGILSDEKINKLRKIFDEFSIQNNCTVYEVRSKQEVIAGAVFLEWNNRNIFLFSGMNETGRDKRAMFFLLNHYIFLKQNSRSILDFEGSNDEALYRFYAGFGGKEENYFQIKINRLPKVLKWLK